MSEMHRKFFILVKGVQRGKISPKRVGSIITEAAKTISSKDVDDFIYKKSITKKKLNETIDHLKNLIDPRTDLRYDITGANSTGGTPVEPMYLDEEGDDVTTERNPIAKTFQQKGNFEQYIQRFSGLEIKPKEFESITNYTEAKPTKVDKYSIRYEGTDEFSNSTITVIKKLREGNDLVFTAFQISKSQNTQDAEQQPTEEDDIVVNKSVSFRDEIEGGKILADMIPKLEI